MNTAKTDIDERLDYLQYLARAARDITLPLFANPEGVVNKASGENYDPVTKADIDAEIALRKLIRQTFPDDGIEGEECPDHVGSNAYSWTLDPIDGTRAFVAGVPVWSTLIALSFKSRPVLGMIDLPAMDKSFFGRIDGKTRKAWVQSQSEDRKVLKTASCPKLKDAILGCTEPLAMLRPKELTAYNKIRRTVRFSRLGLDAYGYCLVASGRMNIIVESLLKPCDVRALIPVIEGAGGKLTNWEGGSAVDGGRVVAVGDEALLPQIYASLSDVS